MGKQRNEGRDPAWIKALREGKEIAAKHGVEKAERFVLLTMIVDYVGKTVLVYVAGQPVLQQIRQWFGF